MRNPMRDRVRSSTRQASFETKMATNPLASLTPKPSTFDSSGRPVIVISPDRVTRIHAARLVETLGYPSPQVCESPPHTGWGAGDVVLLDVSSPFATDALLQWGDARVILLANPAENVPQTRGAVLRKPLSQVALVAALSERSEPRASRHLPGPARPVELDPAKWQELWGLFGESGLRKMVIALERDLPLRAQNLASAGSDPLALRRLAHTLRSVAEQFGVESLAAQCLELETDARNAHSGNFPVGDLGLKAQRMLERYAALIVTLGVTLDDG